MYHIIVDGKPFEAAEGSTILEVCRENQIYIPTLCYHPALEPHGACRLCMVEINQPGRSPRLVAACVTPCEEGMQIETMSAEVVKSRRMTAELLLAEDENNFRLRRIAEELGVTKVFFRTEEQDSCILCSLCVRACKEIVGVSAISTIYRGFDKKVSPPFQIESETCIGCGTCVLVCPTDAIKLRDISGFAVQQKTVMANANVGSNGKHLVQKALRVRQLGKNSHRG